MENENQKEQGEEQVKQEQEEPGNMRIVAIGIFVIVILIFAAIVLFTGILGNFLGKSAEMAALIIFAIILVILLYKSKRS